MDETAADIDIRGCSAARPSNTGRERWDKLEEPGVEGAEHGGR